MAGSARERQIRAMRSRVCLSSALVVLGAAPQVTSAQRPPQPAASPAPAPALAKAVIRGTVYDSLSNGPLRRANVRLDGTEYAAVTDTNGAFRVVDVAPGEYVLAIDHPAFDSLGVGLPYGRVRVMSGDTIAVVLATPSVATIARGLCAGLGTDSAGVLLGAVRRAGAAAGDPAGALAGTRVTARWVEFVPARATLTKVARELAATADAAGVYRLCGVPNDVAVQLTAAPPPSAGVADVRTGTALVDLSGRTVTLRDVAVRVFATADSTAGAAAGGTRDDASLVLTVVDETGQPFAGAQLRSAGRDAPLGVSDSTGVLRVRGLPAGSQAFQLLAFGRAPETVSAALRNGATTTSRVRVGARVSTQLAGVRVVGRAGFDRGGFEERRHTGQGRYLAADEVARRQATAFSQLVVGQPGFVVTPNRPNDPTGRVSGFTITSSRGAVSLLASCSVQFFVDGVPVVTTDAQNVDDVVNPSNIRGVEFYAGNGPVPPQFTLASRNACGTIVIWTHGTGARR